MMLPEAFVTRLRALLGPAEASALCLALAEGDSPVSVRRNPAKCADEELRFFAAPAPASPTSPTASTVSPEGGAPAAEATADPAPLLATPVPWCAYGRYLSARPAFALDPRWHAGAYYVQEAASMFVAAAYAAAFPDEAPRRVLDLCAAPGGKSTLWRTLLPDDALLVANEPVKSRANILAENLTKWGNPNTVVANAYPADFGRLISAFDLVAADVPCSGEGMFRKDLQAREEWSPEAVARCAERQREILRDVWPALRPGGYLVYSTCTFNREENEDVVQYACDELGAELIPIPTAPDWPIADDTTGRGLAVYHFFPHRTAGEGLFLALLRKTSGTSPVEPPTAAASRRPARDKRRKVSAVEALPRELRTWLRAADDFDLRLQPDGRWHAVARPHADFVERLAAVARLLVSGVTVAERKGPKLIPHAALALSTALSPEAFPTVALSPAEARAFLRREALVLPPDAPRGYVLATFEGLSLGWLNNLGSRANNLYPSEWRLRVGGA